MSVKPNKKPNSPVETSDHSYSSYTVCRRFARILGGDLTLNDDYADGCQFVLSLTLKKVTETKMKFNNKFGKRKSKVPSKSPQTKLIDIPEESEIQMLESSDPISSNAVRTNLDQKTFASGNNMNPITRIVIADNCYLTIELQKLYLKTLNLSENCDFCMY